VVVVGGGVFGVTIAITLGEHGFDVLLLEKQYDLMREASMVNQNRIHLGYHYPRSAPTAHESLDGMVAFQEIYGDAVVDGLTKYYAIARDGSQTSVDDFARFCEALSLPLTPGWPPEGVLRKEAVAGCWRVPETIFDYHQLRQIALHRLRRCRSVAVARNVFPTRIRVDSPHHVELSDGSAVECDVVINASYAGLGEVEAVAGLAPSAYQYELCLMPILETRHHLPLVGVTIMDGPFCSMMPKGREAGRFILYHVERSVLQRTTAASCPAWEPVRGLVEFDVIEACSDWFPILAQMRYRESWMTTRVVIPYHDDDDARPTTITDHGDAIYSVFSGKLTTCVKAARDLLTHLRRSPGGVGAQEGVFSFRSTDKPID